MSTKIPSFKLVKFEKGRNEVPWRGEIPITRIEVEETYGPGKYIIYMYGPGIRGIKPYDRFTVEHEEYQTEYEYENNAQSKLEIFAAEDGQDMEDWNNTPIQQQTGQQPTTVSDMSEEQLFEAIDRVLDSDIKPEQLPVAKSHIKAYANELKERGTSKERWEQYAAEKGDKKVLYLIGGIVAGGALSALAVAYYYNSKLSNIERQVVELKNQLYDANRRMSTPMNPDHVFLSRYNQSHGGTP